MTTAQAFFNHNRNTCIVYEWDDGIVRAILMQSPELGLLEMGYEQFHSQWVAIEGCDVVEAAQKYLNGLIPYNLEIKSILENITMATAETAAKTKKASPAPKAPKADAAAEKKTAKFFAEQEAKKAAKAPKADAPAKEPKAPKEAKEKAPRAPKEDISAKTITLLPLGEDGPRFQEGSAKQTCYNVIKDGMTVKKYVEACAKKEVEERIALDVLKKLAFEGQKVPKVQIV